MFNTRYERKKSPLEMGGGDRITETAGYLPPQKQIEQFMVAGRRLAESRKEMFDFPDGKEDPSFSDPTRSPNFDLADAFQLGSQAGESVDKAVEDIKAKKKAAADEEKAEFEEFKKSKNSKKKEPDEGSEK